MEYQNSYSRVEDSFASEFEANAENNRTRGTGNLFISPIRSEEGNSLIIKNVEKIDSVAEELKPGDVTIKRFTLEMFKAISDCLAGSSSSVAIDSIILNEQDAMILLLLFEPNGKDVGEALVGIGSLRSIGRRIEDLKTSREHNLSGETLVNEIRQDDYLVSSFLKLESIYGGDIELFKEVKELFYETVNNSLLQVSNTDYALLNRVLFENVETVLKLADMSSGDFEKFKFLTSSLNSLLKITNGELHVALSNLFLDLKDLYKDKHEKILEVILVVSELIISFEDEQVLPELLSLTGYLAPFYEKDIDYFSWTIEMLNILAGQHKIELLLLVRLFAKNCKENFAGISSLLHDLISNSEEGMELADLYYLLQEKYGMPR